MTFPIVSLGRARHFLPFYLFLLFVGTMPAAAQCTVEWTGASSGNWNDAAGWSTGIVPAAGDFVCIRNAGSYTVDVEEATIIHGLSLGGASGTQTLAISSGDFTIVGQGEVGERGVIEIDSDFSVEGLLSNKGEVRWTTGSLSIDGTVANHGLIDIRIDGGSIVSDFAPGQIINTGEVRRSAGKSAVQITPAFENLDGGIVSIDSGAISFRTLQNRQSGTLTGNGTYYLDNDDFINEGILSPGSPIGKLGLSGTYRASSTSELRLEIGGLEAGVDYDQIEVIGTAYLDGVLDVHLVDGFLPPDGTSFHVANVVQLVATKKEDTHPVYGGFTERRGLVHTVSGVALYPEITSGGLTLTAGTLTDFVPTISVSPEDLTASGIRTVTISGQGFSPETEVFLECVDCIDPQDQAIISGGVASVAPTEMTVSFDLTRGDIEGSYDVVVKDPRGGQARAALQVHRGPLLVTVTALGNIVWDDNRPVASFKIQSNRRAHQPLPVRFQMAGSARPFMDYVLGGLGTTAIIEPGTDAVNIPVHGLTGDDAPASELTIYLLDSEDMERGSPSWATMTIGARPPATDFNVQAITPDRGGNAGKITATLAGYGFTEGANVSMSRGGVTVSGEDLEVTHDGRGLKATFDMNGRAMGAWDVTVTSADGDIVSLESAFTVEPSRGADVWAEIVGPTLVRQNFPSSFKLVYYNRGNVDAPAALITLAGMPPGTRIDIDPEYVTSGLEEYLPFAPVTVSDGSQVILPLAVDRIGPGESGQIPFKLSLPNDYSLDLYLHTAPYVDLDEEGEDGSRKTADKRSTNHDTASASKALNTGPALGKAAEILLGNAGRDHFVNNFSNIACQGVAENLRMDLLNEAALPGSPLEGYTFEIVDNHGLGIGHVTNVMTSPDGESFILDNYVIPEIVPVNKVGDHYEIPWWYQGSFKNLERVIGATQLPWKSGRWSPQLRLPEDDVPDIFNPKQRKRILEGETRASFDPNDKLGPAGVAEERYFTGDGVFHYLIRFENLDEAEAPAAEVLVVDQLDASVYDLSTFSLGNITFSDQTVPVPPGLKQFSTVIDLRPEMPLKLLVAGGLDDETGQVTWRFTSLDPNTMTIPEDPMLGFLPPNIAAPEGEGSVSFSIKAQEHLPSGTRIANEARIYFDENEPIDTPEWANTIDTDSPVSRIFGLDAQSDTSFVVTWQGSDGGAGVLNYYIYVSDGDGPFRPWLTSQTDTSAVFHGEAGRTYSFFSIARDGVGNIEPMKTEADAMTSVSVEDGGLAGLLPTTYTLEQNYPNPFNPRTTIRYAVPLPSNVSIRVYDMLGREVARLVDGDHQPGWYDTAVDASHLASGVYFYRMSAGAFTETRRMVVVR